MEVIQNAKAICQELNWLSAENGPNVRYLGYAKTLSYVISIICVGHIFPHASISTENASFSDSISNEIFCLLPCWHFSFATGCGTTWCHTTMCYVWPGITPASAELARRFLSITVPVH
jgi:hypothetical protein